MNDEKRAKAIGDPIYYKGLEYSSLKALVDSAAAEGVTYNCVVGRIRKGWDLDRAINEPRSNNIRRTYIVDGCEYKSLKALAIAAGISYQAAVKRMHRGWRDDEIFHGKRKLDNQEEPSLEKPVRGKPVIINDIAYDNLRHAYDSIQPSVGFNTVKARLRYGWSVEEALGIIDKVDGRKTHERVKVLCLEGKTISAKQAAEIYNISYSTVLDRISRGATDEQAVGLAPIALNDLIPQSEVYKTRKSRNKKSYIVQGVPYQSISELAKAYRLSPKLVYNRIHDNGWSAERAVLEPITETVIVNGQMYRSAMNAYESIGKTSFSVYCERKRSGHSLEICLGLEPLPPVERYELHGKTYSSIAEIALAYDLTPAQLSSRLQRMSLEEAVEYIPSNGRYSEAVFKRNSTFAASIGKLYFIRINLSGILHKVGITQKDISQRFYGYEYQVIALYQGELYRLYQLEQQILTEFRHFHYRADEGFEGKTETFLLMDDEELELLDFITTMAKIHNCSDALAQEI